MKRIIIKIVAVISMVFVVISCSQNKVRFKGSDYTISDSEVGIGFISEFNGVDYNFYNPVYRFPSNELVCKAWGSKEDRVIWLKIKDGTAVEVDSSSVDFSNAEILDRSVLLE